MKIIKCFKDYKMKAFTLSFDDGTVQDIENINLMRFFNLKGTFNLNSSLMDPKSYYVLHEGFRNYRLGKNIIKEIYDGFEVAGHTSTHTDFKNLDEKGYTFEIDEDIKALRKISKQKVEGFAYPYGIYNDTVISHLKNLNVKYARSVNCQFNYELPSNYYTYGGTCTISDANLIKLANKFINKDYKMMKLFYVWGHSYEFDMFHEHERVYNFYKLISNKDDIFYGTNIEIFEYLQALDSLIITSKEIKNNSNIDLYLIIDGKKTLLKKKSSYKAK